MKKWKTISIVLILLVSAMVLVTFLTPPLRSAITQIAGLAVAQTPLQWNNVKDAAVGDAQNNGLMAIGNYVYDPAGATWNRMRGTVGGLIVAGDKTPTDAFVTPTDAIGVQSFLMGYNGATWDMVRITGGALNTTASTSGIGFYAIKRDNIAAASVNLAFGFTSKKVVIECPGSNTDEIVIDWIGGAAAVPAANTAGDDRVAPGRTIILDDYAVTSISVIAASGTQTVYVRAFY